MENCSFSSIRAVSFCIVTKKMHFSEAIIEIERGQELIPKKREKVAGICITDFDYNLNEIYFFTCHWLRIFT